MVPRRPTLSLLAAATVVGVGLVAPPTLAQAPADATATAFVLEHFEPLPGQETNLLNLQESTLLPHLSPSVGLFTHFAYEHLPLFVNIDGQEFPAPVVEGSFKAELLAAVGFFDHVELGLAFPLVPYQFGTRLEDFGRPDEDIDGFSVGDLRAVLKFRPFDPKDAGGFGVTLGGTLFAPTGDKDTFNSSGSLRGEPRLGLDWHSESGIGIVANVAYQIRERKASQRVTARMLQDDILRWGVGVNVPIVDQVHVAGTFVGATTVETADEADPPPRLTDGNSSPMEANLAVAFFIGKHLHLQVGGGFGIPDDVGQPTARGFFSIGYGTFVSDEDDDGLVGDDDKCPLEPEDMDGFEDEDGCPDPDNDGDRVLDAKDKCPDEQEDWDGIADDDGCPEEDPDQDGDGVPDKDDRCPEEPEDKDGMADDDGCPDVDNDADGFMDAEDKCPNDPEDEDGFEDEDGCPDLDNDGDKIPDGADLCPEQPETVNEIDDQDGCPDGPDAVLVVMKGQIKLMKRIHWVKRTARLDARKNGDLLDRVAAELNRHARLVQIGVAAHTSDRGKARLKQKLSEERAAAVKNALVARGVSSARLVAAGYADSKPLIVGKSKDARAANERIELEILQSVGE